MSVKNDGLARLCERRRSARHRLADYRRLDAAFAAAKTGDSFKVFGDLLYSDPETLAIWIACTLPSLTDDQLVFIAARVPVLFPAVSCERMRRRAMEG